MRDFGQNGPPLDFPQSNNGFARRPYGVRVMTQTCDLQRQRNRKSTIEGAIREHILVGQYVA